MRGSEHATRGGSLKAQWAVESSRRTLQSTHLLILGVRSPSVGRDVWPESALGWGKPLPSGRGSALTGQSQL